MKSVFVFSLMLSFILSLLPASSAFAQSVGIKDVPADSDTTIRIEKGNRTEDKFEIITNTDEIEGDSANLKKEAVSNWRTACTEWKKSTKDLHKDSQVVALDCGKRSCTTDTMETTCSSQGTSKVKVRVK